MLFLLLQYLSEFKGGIVHNSKLKKISIALCMALLPISVFAAGLGKLNVMSGLGEPLKADIELISVTPEELNSISASIASQEAYATQGIEKPASHNGIKVSIAKNSAGAPILKLNSAQPISEPFLDMLIQVDWSSGRLLREYTVLLDPPGYTGEADSSAQTAQAPIVSTRGQKKAQQNMAGASQNQEMTADAPVRSPSSTKKSNKHKKAMPVENAGDTEASTSEIASGADYTTQRGDSLAKIARDMKPDGVSLEQMLVGLYQTNPNAFQGDNMNRLKVGQIIRQPSQETLSAISSGAAKKEIKVQTANWNAYRNKLGGMVAESRPTDSEANTQSAGGKIKSAAEDKSTPETTGPKDVVKLSAGDASAGKADSANIKTLQDKIASLQEEAVAREKSVKEAEGRSASLEKQIADMQKLLALKNGAMSDLQKQAETQAAAKTVEAQKPTPAPVEATKPVEAAKTEALATEPAKPEAVKPAVKPIPVPEPVEEQGFISSMMDGLDLGLLAPLGGALALLGGGWMYLRKKREKSLSDFEQGIMTSGGLKANTVFGNTASSSVDTGDTSFLTDFSQSANGGMIDTNDVDPIAEAEVYMAYGRDAQAEEILKDAIAKEPKRHELHLKLLEMYAASKNLSAFETVAGELYTSLGAEDPTWAKVAEIGIKLEPNNPLYQVNSQPTGSLDATDFADSPLAAEKDLDFSFDNDALTKGFAPTGVAATAVAGLAMAGAAAIAGKDVEAATASNALESTDLEMFATNEIADTDLSHDSGTLDISGADDNAMDFDMGSFGNEVETIQTAAEEFGHTMPGNEMLGNEMLGNEMPNLDVPTFTAPQFMPETSTATGNLDELGAKTDELTESFEFPTEATDATLDVASMDAHFADAKVSDETDFNFDVPTMPPEAESFKNTDFSDANSFDLTTIDLDMGDAAASKDPAMPVDTPAAVSSTDAEPIEIETKLDLVAAYIEMDDKEGAKELLDEVIKEGGASQRKRAEALLVKLA
jgi:pilus assembly protein FimV